VTGQRQQTASPVTFRRRRLVVLGLLVALLAAAGAGSRWLLAADGARSTAPGQGGVATAARGSLTNPAATANFLYSDSDSKLITQPQIRASDGQKASLKIGERVPVATGSFQPGIGGVGINPLVNTQFNYIDVGVNIDITPRVHGLDEVTLKLTMDISAVDSYQNIGGIQQPVIGQRKIEQEIRLKEGEVNILGGILESTQTKSLSGIPGLAQIPLFKYLFAEESKEVKDNEIVFILIPHIVRAQDLNDSNVKAIDVGTANTISLPSNHFASNRNVLRRFNSCHNHRNCGCSSAA